MKKIFVTLLLFIVASLWATPALAQSENPVSWSISSKHIQEDMYDLIIEAHISAPWHLYDQGPYDGGPVPTSFVFEPAQGVTLVGKVKELTKATKVEDPTFGMTIGYFVDKALFSQRIRLSSPQATIKAMVEWMVCNDKGCMPPEEYDLQISVKQVAAAGGGEAIAATVVAPAEAVLPKVADSTLGNAEISVAQLDSAQTAVIEPMTQERETSGSLWATIIEAILWGFAALLTPCVFPMVPMTVSFFMKGERSATRGRFMAAMYGFFIIALYTIPIAVIILITRIVGGDAVTADIFNWLATHWLPNVIFFVVFMLFAASFFGAFEITMPSWLVNKSDQKADKGGLGGLFFMALTLVLVSFSCTGPIVGSVLIKSTAGQIWEPVVTMLAFSTAFALPFALFAFFPSLLSGLPKSGGWLNSVKVVLGFIEVALGMKFLSVADQTYHWGLLDREVYLAVWIVVFSLMALYLLGKLKFAHDSELKHITVTRLALSIAVLSFVVYMIPGMFGAPLKALSGYLPPIHTQDFVLGQNTATVADVQNESAKEQSEVKYGDFLHLPHGLKGYFNFEQAMQQAQKQGKPLFVDFTGHGCVNCREMEARVWSDARVLEILRRDYVIVALYSDDKKEVPQEDWVTTQNGKVLKTLGKINSYFARTHFGINAQPYYLILGADGKQIVPARGYDLSVEGFVSFLEGGVKAYKQ